MVSAMCLCAFAVHSKPWIFLGDFNIVANVQERIGNPPHCLGSIEHFMDFTYNLCVNDVIATGAFFIWWNKQEVGELVQSKLDRILCNLAWLCAKFKALAYFAEPRI